MELLLSHSVSFTCLLPHLQLTKLRVKLAPQKLYSADGYAVQELAKIAKVLVDAGRKQDEKVKCHQKPPFRIRASRMPVFALLLGDVACALFVCDTAPSPVVSV